MLLGLLLLICLGCTVYSPCKVPDQLSDDDLIGEWELEYGPGYWVSDPIEGSLTVSGTTAYLIEPGGGLLPLSRCNWLVGYKGQLNRAHACLEKWCPQLRTETYYMEGTGVLHLQKDGTYRQTFKSSEYSYTGPVGRWEFVSADEAPDGPKGRLHGMKYFVRGSPRRTAEYR